MIRRLLFLALIGMIPILIYFTMLPWHLKRLLSNTAHKIYINYTDASVSLCAAHGAQSGTPIF